jgi:nuclease-like protein
MISGHLGDRRHGVNYARLQQHRRVLQAGRAGVASAVAALLGAFVISAGAALSGGVLLVVAAALGLGARHWLSRAGRSSVGVRSEDEMRRALEPLGESGWRLRHGLCWPRGGDIDSLAIAPTGVAFAIETKTRTYDDRQLARVRAQAGWLSRRRRRWCRRGALPVLCVVRARRVERMEQGVLVVSIDRLTLALRDMAAQICPRAPVECRNSVPY